ncbi:MAG: hypothetical protein C7B43_12710 [Sulfobacillus benefaciens]|uniref:Uncharacterized protein n=1 Tax=Sulfobacillus benefaciens TaxID=453960 RepID=A0A2T2WXR6_9FIRM|nr:MAG: hypothetical protein C7B43_12710 [Sulfobacillus benefaciens]
MSVYPPGDVLAGLSSPVYHEFSAHIMIINGWSGSGIWDNSGQLMAITTFYNNRIRMDLMGEAS